MAAIVIILVGLAAYWWFHPPINIHSTDTWMFVAVFILLPLFLLFWSKSHSYKNGTGKGRAERGQGEGLQVGVITCRCWWPSSACWRLGVAIDLPGNAAKYANVLQTVEETFADDIKEVNYLRSPSSTQLGHFAGQPRDGLHPRVRQPVRDLALYSQINYQSAPVRVSPLGLRRPV